MENEYFEQWWNREGEMLTIGSFIDKQYHKNIKRIAKRAWQTALDWKDQISKEKKENVICINAGTSVDGTICEGFIHKTSCPAGYWNEYNPKNCPVLKTDVLQIEFQKSKCDTCSLKDDPCCENYNCQ